ncbi:hypothetical protein T459_34126 [Capsicum annuum]|uniref:Ubiquitin-like protease family profile domain-containing protein n=1 Tax=Capsicum annuum TaxID=4072 RepID=A0A2G2XX18_CAPAN|nr:hypothetical protein T459_34126 [Capsicum annuum]
MIAPRPRFEFLMNAMFNDNGKEQVVDIKADKPNVDEGGLEQSGQHFNPDVVQSSDNIFDGTKQQHADKDPDLQNMNYFGTERSPQRLSSEVDQKLKANLLGKKGCTDLHSKKMNVEIDSQQLIPDELLRSINLNYLHLEKVVQHDCQTSDEKIDETILFDSQFTISDEMLPSLNAYQIQSIIIHLSTNRQEESHHEILNAKTSEIVIEDHDQMNRGITDSEVELATEEQVSTLRNTQEVTNDEQRDEQLWPDSQNTIPDEFLSSLNVYNQKSIIIHLSANREVKTSRPKLRISRPSKFKEFSYTKKFGLAATCDFYVKKRIDLQNHPRYKDKESLDMFDVLFEDDLPQQPSGSLDCGVFMVMYAECLSYGHKVIATEFDPNALRTRYATLLWDYGIQKQEANVISDVEAPVRPASSTNVADVLNSIASVTYSSKFFSYIHRPECFTRIGMLPIST